MSLMPDIVLAGFHREDVTVPPESPASSPSSARRSGSGSAPPSSAEVVAPRELLKVDAPARTGLAVKLLVTMQSGKPANVTMVGEVFAVHDATRLSAMVEVESSGPQALRGLWHATLVRDETRWALSSLDPIVPALDEVDLSTLDEATRRALAARLASQADELDVEHAPLADLALLAVRFHPSPAGVRRAAMLFPDGGDPERLARLTDEALKRGEDEEPLLRSVVELYERLHLVDEALSVARRACERLPDRWFPWARLAALTKDDAPAERAADRALELLGDSTNDQRDRARLHFLRGGMRYRRSFLEGAEQDYTTAASLAPESPAHHLGLATVLRALERFDEAERACDRSIGAAKDHAPAWALRAELRSRRGDLPSALRDLERALILRPKDPELAFQRALLRRQAGDAQLARADFEKAAALGHPQAAEALRELAEMLIDVGSRVRHTKFGEGEVIGIEPGASERKITVAFAEAGKKTLLERFLERA